LLTPLLLLLLLLLLDEALASRPLVPWVPPRRR
jgi:hypothetical protein